MLIPHRLFYLLLLAFADVSAFSGVTSRARGRNDNDNVDAAVRLHRMTVLGCSSSGNHDTCHKSSHIVSIKSSNIAGMVNDGDDIDIEVDFGPEACLVAVTGER